MSFSGCVPPRNQVWAAPYFEAFAWQQLLPRFTQEETHSEVWDSPRETILSLCRQSRMLVPENTDEPGVGTALSEPGELHRVITNPTENLQSF